LTIIWFFPDDQVPWPASAASPTTGRLKISVDDNVHEISSYSKVGTSLKTATLSLVHKNACHYEIESIFMHSKVTEAAKI
jgi:hypothetical protein